MTGVQVLSHISLNELDQVKKVKKILEIVRKGDIVMIEGRLTSEEELSITSKALASVSGKFSGVEIAYLNSKKTGFKDVLLKLLASERLGITVVGPSKIIKEIKMDPNKLEVMLK